MKARFDPVNREYALAKSADFKAQVLREMERQSMSRSEFAERMGWTRSAASHFFNGNTDILLGTADLCGLVLGGDVDLVFRPRIAAAHPAALQTKKLNEME